MVEIRILKRMMHGGKPIEPGEVVAMGKADAAYCVSIGRAEFIESAKPQPSILRVRKAKESAE